MTEQRHACGRGPILLLREGPAQLWRQAQRRKYVGRYPKTFQLLWRAAARQIETVSIESDQMFESLRLRLVGAVIFDAFPEDVTTVKSFRHRDQPLQLVVRHGIEQHCIDDAEDRTVRPNTERQRDDRTQREDRAHE